MATTNELLKEHNDLAKKTGKLPLKVWKGDKNKLIARINDLKKSPKKVGEVVDKEDGLITISEIAEGINMDPKVARAKLRRKGMKSNEGRWSKIKKDSKEHKDLVDLLKGRKAE